MKVVLVNLGGTLTVGDTLQLHHTTPRGGRSSGGYIIKEGDTTSSVIYGLVSSCRNGYIGEFDIKAKDESILIMCSNAVMDAIFIPEVLGVQTETLTVTEL